MIRSLNPDAYIRERIFQRIVDHTGIAPQKTKWTFFRVFAIGILLSYGAMVLIGFGQSAGRTPDPSVGVAMLLLALFTVVAIRNLVNVPQHDAFDFFTATMRLVCVTTGCAMAYYSVGMMLGYHGTSTINAVTMHSVTVSWIAGVTASYLNICRTPPPRTCTENKKAPAR